MESDPTAAFARRQKKRRPVRSHCPCGGYRQQRDNPGRWAVILRGLDGGLLAADTGGNLYVCAYPEGIIQKRDNQGNWLVISDQYSPWGLAVDARE